GGGLLPLRGRLAGRPAPTLEGFVASPEEEERRTLLHELLRLEGLAWPWRTPNRDPDNSSLRDALGHKRKERGSPCPASSGAPGLYARMDVFPNAHRL